MVRCCRSIFTFIFLVVFLFLLTGCTGISKGTINSYVDPTYERGGIKRIAVFSIRNAQFAPSEAREINKKIIQAITQKNPGIKVVSPSESLRKINEAGLAREWANFVDDFYTSGIANKKILGKVSRALGVDGVLQGQLMNVYQSDGNGWDTTGTTRISVSFSIVDSSTAKTVWDVSSEGIVRREIDMAAPPISEAIDLAIEKVILNMPIL